MARGKYAQIGKPAVTDTGSVRKFLERSGWVRGPLSIEYLAAGEYNENFRVRGPEGQYVFRINHGSQLGLEDQIAYEFRVLKAVEPSGVTPRAFFCEPHPDCDGIRGGVLLMEYLAGRRLDYRIDSLRAAGLFARIHALPADNALIRQNDPVGDIASESLKLLELFPDHPRKREQARLLDYHEEILRLAERTRGLFRVERHCIVNTEVNSGNFLVQSARAFLVDWEKAVVSVRYQDLAHFLVPTTTLWKTDYRYAEEGKRAFLRAYRERLGSGLGMEELIEKTSILERTILLRALSWCYMAYWEYARGGRNLHNLQTFERIRLYLKELDTFLGAVPSPGNNRRPYSIIIPVLGEQGNINAALRQLEDLQDASRAEVIVVDGGQGSTVAAIETRPRPFALRTLTCGPGRARQLNRGAAAAEGELLVFLHADTFLPRHGLRLVQRTLRSHEAGVFSFATLAPSPFFRFWQGFINFRIRLLRLPFGDQALFIRARSFRRLGGFRDMPIMEDVDLVRRLRRRPKGLHILATPVRTSDRRWRRRGFLPNMLRNLALILLYRLGVPPRLLAKAYPANAGPIQTGQRVS